MWSQWRSSLVARIPTFYSYTTMAPIIPSSTSLEDPTENNTLGAAFLGCVGSGILFGITCLQGYLYYHRYPKDSLLHKIAVAALWVLDAIHLALTIHAVYFYLVQNFGHPEAFTNIVWSLKLQVSFNVTIILIVQSLYAYRVWLLGGYHHGVLGYLVALVVAAGFAVGILLAYAVYTVDTFAALEHVSWAINSSLASSTAIDFTMAAAMCYYLSRSMSLGESGLNSRISTVMQYTLGSGLLTSACSLSTLFTYNLMPNNFIFLSLEFLLTRLYVGSFLAMLNARQRPQPESSHKTTTSTALPSVHFRVSTTVVRDPEVCCPSVPSPSSQYSSDTSTYVSCEQSKTWDRDTMSDAESTVLPRDDFICRVDSGYQGKIHS
ncbi:hypothetical protein L218DRAFT_925860 [Marasmius fiardii PR-910]|nr:hypothetical protein L218DRAFT_925860 [Marasmius fiardii PR-910]